MRDLQLTVANSGTIGSNQLVPSFKKLRNKIIFQAKQDTRSKNVIAAELLVFFIWVLMYV